MVEGHTCRISALSDVFLLVPWPGTWSVLRSVSRARENTDHAAAGCAALRPLVHVCRRRGPCWFSVHLFSRTCLHVWWFFCQLLSSTEFFICYTFQFHNFYSVVFYGVSLCWCLLGETLSVFPLVFEVIIPFVSSRVFITASLKSLSRKSDAWAPQGQLLFTFWGMRPIFLPSFCVSCDIFVFVENWTSDPPPSRFCCFSWDFVLFCFCLFVSSVTFLD